MPVYYDKNRKTYFFKICINYKQFLRRGFLTFNEAKIAEAEFIAYRKYNNTSIKTYVAVFNEYIDSLRHELAHSSIVDYTRTLNTLVAPFFKNTPLKKISLVLITRFQQKLINNKYDYKYIKKIMNLCEAAFTYGYKLYDVNDNPFLKLQKVRSTKSKKDNKLNFYSYDEFMQFYNAIDNVMDQSIFSLLFFCGLRVGELLALQFKDITDTTININKTVAIYPDLKNFIQAPKSKSSIAVLPLPNAVKKPLFAYIKEIKKTHTHIRDKDFLFGVARPIGETTIKRHYEKIREKANIKKIRIHDFRHSTATYYLSKNIPINVVKEIMRHSSISMTMRYVHVSNELVESALNDTAIIRDTNNDTNKYDSQTNKKHQKTY